MIEDLRGLSLVESEVESHSGDESNTSNEDVHVRHISVALGLKRIVSELISVRLIMSVRLIHDQVGVRVWREDVFVTAMERSETIDLENTYWNMERPFKWWNWLSRATSWLVVPFSPSNTKVFLLQGAMNFLSPSAGCT